MMFDQPCVDSYGNDICNLKRQSISAMGHTTSQSQSKHPSQNRPDKTPTVVKNPIPQTPVKPPIKKPSKKSPITQPRIIPQPYVKPPVVTAPYVSKESDPVKDDSPIQDDENPDPRFILRKAQDVFEFINADTVAYLKRGRLPDGKFPFQPTLQALPEDANQMAKLVRLSGDVQSQMNADILKHGEAFPFEKYANEVNGTLQRMQKLNMGSFELADLKYQSGQQLVFRNTETGKYWIAARGTDSKRIMTTGSHAGQGERSIWPDIAITGNERGSEPYVSIRQLFKQMLDDGIDPTDMIGGGSSMGARVYHAGDEFGVKTIVFGAASGINDVYGDAKHPEITHDFYSTTTDLPSAMVRRNPPKNIKVNTLDFKDTFKNGKVVTTPVYSNPFSIDYILKHHTANQFSSEDEILLFKEKLKEQLAAEQNEAGVNIRRLGIADNEAKIVMDARDTIKSGGTYTDFIQKTTSIADLITVDGKVKLNPELSRMGKDSNFYKYWIREIKDMAPDSSPDKYFTTEEIDYLNTHPASNNDASSFAVLSDEELAAVRDGTWNEQTTLDSMDKIAGLAGGETPDRYQEMFDTLDKIDLKKSPEFMNRFRKFAKMAEMGGQFGLTVALQKTFEAMGVDDKEAQDALAGASMSVVPVIGDTTATVLAAERAKKVSKALGEAPKVISAVDKIRGALEKVGKVSEAGGEGAASFVVADKVFDGTQQLLKAFGVNDDNSLVLSSGASMGAAASTSEGTSAASAAAKKAAKTLADAAKRAGTKITTRVGEEGIEMTGRVAAEEGGTLITEGGELITKTLARSSAEFVAEAGIKVISAGMKASMVGAALGEGIDIGINTYSLFDKLGRGDYASIDEVDTSVNNILNPLQFLDDMAGSTYSDRNNEFLHPNKFKRSGFEIALGSLFPVTELLHDVGQGGAAISYQIGKANHAMTADQIHDTYLKATQKVYRALADQSFDPRQHSYMFESQSVAKLNQRRDEELAAAKAKGNLKRTYQIKGRFGSLGSALGTLDAINDKYDRLIDSERLVNQTAGVLTDAEYHIINQLNPNFFSDVGTQDREAYNNTLIAYKRNEQRSDVHDQINDHVFVNDQTTLNRLKESDPEFYQMVLEHNQEQQQRMENLHLNQENYINYITALTNGKTTLTPIELYNNLVTNQANAFGYASAEHYIMDQEAGNTDMKSKEHQSAKDLGLSEAQYVVFYSQYQEDGSFQNAGYSSFEDYIEDIKTATNEAYEREADEAQDYTEAQQIASDDGFYDMDEYAYNADMTQWSPDVSQILRAHSIGLTLHEFDYYMDRLSTGGSISRKTAYQFSQLYKRDPDGKVRSIYTEQDVDAMNREDYFHLQEDLLRAGYDRNLYNSDFTLNAKVSAVRSDSAASDFQNMYPNYHGDINLIPNADILRREIGEAAFQALRQKRLFSQSVSTGRAMGMTGDDRHVYDEYLALKNEDQARYDAKELAKDFLDTSQNMPKSNAVVNAVQQRDSVDKMIEG